MTTKERLIEATKWLASAENAKSDETKLEKFEAEAIKLRDETLERLMTSLKELLKTHGVEDWECYLDDFDVFSWEEGQFQDYIDDYIAQQIEQAVNDKNR